jgi:tRNA(fMet)-specific endonuclease VapC
MIFLLETNTLIYVVRRFKITSPKSARQREQLERAKRVTSSCRQRQEEGGLVGLSAITVAELEYGARYSGNYEKEIAAVEKILTPFMIYDFDAIGCAQDYGEIRYELEQAGLAIGAMDLLIAAHAKALGATLITSDTTHFRRVKGLKHQNWALQPEAPGSESA